MYVTFLGTSGAVPTPARNPSSLQITHEDRHLLFDVGENTVRQLARFEASEDISAVYITHTHGDHVLGLPGLLHKLQHSGRTSSLPIYTPRGTTDRIEQLTRVLGCEFQYDIDITPVTVGDTIRGEDWTVTPFETEHQTRAVGYVVTPADDDGCVVYTGDTRPTDATVTAAADADVLVHDAMFGEANADRARETGHSTAAEAGTVAERAGVDTLVLTHTSPRHAGEEGVLGEQARETFSGSVILPDDGERIGPESDHVWRPI